MKHLQHPTEIALEIIKEGIEAGQKASDIKADIMYVMDIEEVVADRLLKDFLSRKVIFKHFIEDDMMGKIYFYSFEKPKPRPVKKVGSMVIAQSFMSGNEVAQSIGIRHFAKSHQTSEQSPPRSLPKRTIAQNSTIFKRALPTVNYERTKFPIRFERTKFPIKFTRTK